MQYDKLGRRTLLVDPDQGSTAFEYNGFGELTRSTHYTDNGLSTPDLTTDYHRDDLGRVHLRVDTIDNDPAAAETTTYDYDTAPHGRGKLRHTASPDGIETFHTYDDLGRPKVTQWKIGDVSYQFERVL